MNNHEEPIVDLVGRVHRFNVIGQTTPPSSSFNADRVGFYTGMQFEELAEKLKAIGEGAVTPSMREELLQFAKDLDLLGKNFKAGHHMGDILRADREALLDADIDIAVVTQGSMAYQTPRYRGAIGAVLDANDAKMPNGVVTRDANGKIQKPEGWKPADLTPFLVQPT